MLEHTKKHPIEKISLLFEGPKEKQREAIHALKVLGFTNTINNSLSVPWREAFPEFTGNEPGICLAASRSKNGMTQATLSDLTGIPRCHISEMENGKRPIGKMIAKKLSTVLDVDYRVFG